MAFGATGAYLAAELMIKGLQSAGQNPTRTSFIFEPDAGNRLECQRVAGQLGELFSTTLTEVPERGLPRTGSSEPTRCSYYVQVKGNAFVSINSGKPICGTSF